VSRPAAVHRASSATAARLLEQIRDAEVVALARDLVRIPSVHRPGDPAANESRVAAHIEAWLRREGLAVEVQPVAPGRPNVLAWLGEGGGPALLLEGHTDVVTEGDPAAWSRPPFGADLVDGRIYGRGAADMKGGLAAALVALAAFRRAGVRPKGRLVVGALVDEEGEMVGARHLCRSPLGRGLSAAIICEPEQNEICLEQRGVAWARVRVTGRMAHGAMPRAGVNPIAALASVVAEGRRLEQRLRRLAEPTRHLEPPTVSPTILRAPLHGVPQPNVIPAAAEAVLDIRLTPGVEAERVGRELDALVKRVQAAHPGTRVQWEPVTPFRPPTRVKASERLVRAVAESVRQVTGRAPRYGGVPGSTDGTILRSELGIPIVTLGPGPRTIPHQVDEYVEVRELVDAARIYALSALKFLEG
jgi:succinyl-diaminopimelate desuccinylase